MKSETADKSSRWLLSLLVAAFILRVVGIWYGLPSLYNSDEPFNVVNALAYGAKKSLEPTYFVYPGLYSYVLFMVYAAYFVFGRLFGVFSNALDFGAAYFLDPTGLFLVGRLLSVGFGVVTVWLVYRLGARFFSRRVGLLAALLLTLSITHTDISHWILVEPAAGFMVALALYLLLRFADAPSVRTNMVAGVVCGLAISTKYNAGFLFVPLLLAVVSRFKSRRAELLEQFVLATASLVLGFLLGSPYWIPRISAYMNDLHYTLNHMGAGMVGHVRSVPFLWPILELLLREWTVGFFFVAGLIYLLFNRTRNFWLLGAFVLPTLLFVGSWTRTGIHYLLPLFPALAVLAALFLDSILRLSQGRAASHALLFLLLLPPAAKIGLHDVRLTQPDVRSEAKAWMETHIPEGSVIAYENYVYGPNLYDPMRFFKNEEENRLLPVELKERLLQERRKRPTYRLVNLRKDFHLRILHEKGATGRTKGNLYIRQLLDRRLPKLAALKKAGIPYLMVSSDNYDRYFKTQEPAKGTALWFSYQNGRHFYGGLFRSPDWVLVQEFKPGFWNLGPTIRIYRAREQTESGP